MTRYEFPLPDPGEGLTEGEIVEWHVEEGDEVEEDDVLGEVETDKAVTELPAPCPGTIDELAAEVGEVVSVGETVVVFETDEPPSGAETESGGAEEETEETETEGEEEGEAEDSGEADEETGEETDEREPDEEGEEGEEATTETDSGGAETEETETETEEQRVFAAPRTRRYAREESVDLTEVDGSGPDGRVLQEDIDAFLSGDGEAEAAGAETTGDEGETGTQQEATHPAISVEPVSIGEDEERSTRRDLSGLRARIAENMTRSATIVPHVTSGFETDAEAFVSLRERLNGKHDARITYTPLLVKAVVPALEAFPLVNASLDDETDEIVEKNYYNVGFATHTEDGLIVPVIKDVNDKSIVDIAEELATLAEQARDRSIDMADLQGGTFTVTNLAADGEHRTHGSPIINHPEAAIMGVGRIHKAPVVTEDDEGTDEIEIRQRLPLSLTFDHRLIDGVTANRFMEYVIEGIEDPDVLLSRL